MKIFLINYDNGSRWPVLPQNLYHLKACLSLAGHDVEIIDFNLNKRPYEYLLMKITEPCIVGLGFISGYWPHKETIKIADVIKNSHTRHMIKFVLGGHGPSAAPEYYLKKLDADAVFVGAADKSMPEWIDSYSRETIVQSNGYDMNVQNVFTGNEMEIYKRIRFPKTEETEFALQVLSSYGCPYNCAFCYRMEKGGKLYPVDVIINDIRAYYYMHGIRHFQFSDELLMVSNDRCEEICDGLRRLQKEIGEALFFDCNGRLNVAAEYPEILETMKEVGFRYINYGCESMSQKVLDNINKHQTVEQIHRGVYNTIEAGLSPGLNFMWGNPGDNYESLMDAMRFIIAIYKAHTDYAELRTIRPVTPYPGTELFKKLDITVQEFYDQHVNSDLFSYHFMDMSNQQANNSLFYANMQIIQHHNFNKTKIMVDQAYDFYKGNTDPEKFRGFREV